MGRTLELVESWVSDRTQWHFVVLRDGALSAVGECSDAGRSSDLVAEMEAVAPALVGRDLVADRDDVLAGLAARVEAARPGNAFMTATLMGGLAQLLVDLAAQVAGEPTWKWLGASTPDPVPLYANINRMPGGRRPEDVAAMAQQAVVAGFQAVKCAPFDLPLLGESLPFAGLARLRAVRAAVGDEVGLKVDCHERLPVDDVHALLPHLAELGIDWLEDAVGVHDVDGLRALRAATSLPLAGGEFVFSQHELEPAIAENLLDVLMPDVKHAGGIQRVLSIAQSAPGLAVSPHNPSGPVATAASAHALVAVSNATALEYQFGETSWRSDLVGGQEHVVEGRLVLSERPGLGVTLQARDSSSRILWSTTI
jgi:galactonate dehydratase